MDAFELEFASGNRPFERAFEEALPAMRALPDAQIVAVNLPILEAVAKVLGVEPALLALEARIAGALPEAARDLPEKLGRYALALSHSHFLYRSAVRANDPLPALADEGTKLRKLLFSDAKAIVHRAFVDEHVLRNYTGSTSYRKLARELHMLAQLFRDCAESASGSTAATAKELDRADELAAGILKELGKRTIPDPAVQAAADVRNRAFTLLTRGYDQVRRAVIYLRWDEGDADKLVPSLYTKRHRSRKKAGATEARTVPVATDNRLLPGGASAPEACYHPSEESSYTYDMPS